MKDHHALMSPPDRHRQGHRFWITYLDSNLHWFATCTMLFHLANATMLPLAVSALGTGVSRRTGLTVSAAVLVSQFCVAVLSARLGRDADRHGRRPLLLLGFAALPARGLLLAIFPGAIPLVCIQTLDGISGAVMGIMVPLVSADLTRRTGFLNLAIGSLGLAAGIGAATGTLVGGWLADRAGTRMALLALSLVGCCAFALLALVMPETRPPRDAG